MSRQVEHQEPTTPVTKMLTVKNLSLDDAVIAIALEGRVSDERRTLRTQCLWMNFFFTILAVVRLKR
jgi:hypothetical protein